MADEMSSSAWILMDDDCSDCGGAPPMFHLPPPPIPPDLPCDMDMTCPSLLNVSDAEFKRIGAFPSVTVIVCCSLLSFVILLVIAALVWKYVRIKKKRKGVTQTKDFDHHHHGPTMMNGNGVLYEDLSHARPRPPIAPPSIEMMDVTHPTLGSNGIGNTKMDFSYFLNPPPIYEELPDHSDRNNGPSEDEFAEDELSVIDVPITHDGSDPNILQGRYQNHKQFSSSTTGRNSGKSSRAQSLTRKRPSRGSGSGSGSTTTNGNGSSSVFSKSQRSLDRRSRNNLVNNGITMGKYNGTATNPRGYSKHNMGMEDNHMLILSNPNNGMTMKIPPHLVAVLAESCNGARPYEIIPTSMSGGHAMSANPSNLVVGNGVLVNGGVNGSMVNGGVNGIYPSSRSSGSSYGEGGSSSNSSARNNPGGNSIESSSFDSGIGPHSITSFINSPAYDQTILPPSYPMNAYEYAAAGQMNPSQYLTSQHPSFRRLRMTVADRDHPLNPLYSNHLLT